MRLLSARRRALLPVLGLTAALLAPAGAASAAVTVAAPRPASATLQARVAALQAEVERTARELEQGARAWEAAQRRLGVVTQQQFAVDADLERQRSTARDTRDGVDAMVRAAYMGAGVPPTVTALLSGDTRALSDLARVRATVDSVEASRRADLRTLAVRRDAGERLLVRREALRRRALAEQQDADARQHAVTERAGVLAARLTATAADLDRALVREAQEARRSAAARAAAAAAAASERAAALARAAAAAAGAALPAPVALSYVPGGVSPADGGECAPTAPHGYPNGFLPDSVLCPLPGRPGARLRTDAAQSFVAMDAARVASGGAPLCVTDTYRDYAGQVAVFATKPNLAAVPGRSKHGWGLAIDFCGGIERFDGEAHHWMAANAARFGWVHPSWAEPGGSKPEPWHWEFQG